tara:strand:- start:95 stop:409 length:315 start_codon:yes stop_codon:yes gene_type:complete
MDDLVTCEYCGNVWDGNAQCNCYESMIESDEQIMDMVSSSNNIAVETGNEQQVETDEQIMGLVAPSNYTTVVIQSDTRVEAVDTDEVDTESLSSHCSMDETFEL